MGVHYFPCQFVYWREIENHKNFKKVLLNSIENNKSVFKKHDLIGSGLSSFKPCDDSGFIDFNRSLIIENQNIIKEVVWDSLDELLKELNSRKGHRKINIRDSIITNSWISIYDKKSSVSCHCHLEHFEPNYKTYMPSFVVVYILNDTNKHNMTEFMQPLGQIPTTSNALEYRFHTSQVDEIHEGVVMIFPANLYHQVNTLEKENRTIYTFNIASSFIN